MPSVLVWGRGRRETRAELQQRSTSFRGSCPPRTVPYTVPQVVVHPRNLIENALDAVNESGHIRVAAQKELERAVVRVIDDGPRIEPELISRVFDPFFTTKAPGQGMGLGLEITRQLVRHHRGEVSVDSRPGRTEFCVRLLEAPPGIEDNP